MDLDTLSEIQREKKAVDDKPAPFKIVAKFLTSAVLVVS